MTKRFRFKPGVFIPVTEVRVPLLVNLRLDVEAAAFAARIKGVIVWVSFVLILEASNRSWKVFLIEKSS